MFPTFVSNSNQWWHQKPYYTSSYFSSALPSSTISLYPFTSSRCSRAGVEGAGPPCSHSFTTFASKYASCFASERSVHHLSSTRFRHSLSTRFDALASSWIFWERLGDFLFLLFVYVSYHFLYPTLGVCCRPYTLPPLSSPSPASSSPGWARWISSPSAIGLDWSVCYQGTFLNLVFCAIKKRYVTGQQDV